MDRVSESMSYQELLLTSETANSNRNQTNSIASTLQYKFNQFPPKNTSTSFDEDLNNHRSLSGQQQLNNSTPQQLNNSTHQPINPSTTQPIITLSNYHISKLANYRINKLPQCQTNLN
ncbi:MAG: hypothetical protein ACOYN4_20115 [Bacteroidales bacterium]